MERHREVCTVAIVVVVMMAAFASAAAAKTFAPTRTDDPVPGKCKPHDCSLREAISAANARPGADRVQLGAGHYRIELPDDNDDDNGNGDFDVIDKVSIVGKGPARTKVDGQGIANVFSLITFSRHNLRGLTITGGSAPSSVGGGILIGPSKAKLENVVVKKNSAAEGAGIYSGSTGLTMSGSTVKNNTATGRGGGILFLAGLYPPLATIAKSTISGNEAATGAGIDADGTHWGGGSFDKEPVLNVLNTTIAGNTATDPGGGIESNTTALTVRHTTIYDNRASEGAGIDLRPAPAATVTKVDSSTISANTAANKGGGILADGNPFSGSDYPDVPDLRVVNSTIAGNKANNEAGGVMGDNEAKVDIENSSIGFNTANYDDIGAATGGGVYQHSNASFSVDDSVLVENQVGQGGSEPDCSATQVFSGAGNVISSMDGCAVSFTTPFNAYSTSTIARMLAHNGGPTETMAVPKGSAAIGFANNCPKHDQRGRLRPANCDSGSFENRPK